MIGGLDELLAEAAAGHQDVRQLSLRGITTFAAESDLQRAEVSRTLSRVAALTIALLAALLFVVAMLNRLYTIARGRALELEMAGQRMETIVATSLDAVLVVDAQGTLLEFNGAAEKIFGYARQEAIGQQMTDMIFPDHLIAAHQAGMERYHRTGTRRVIGAGRIQMEARRP